MPVYAFLHYQDLPCPYCGNTLKCGCEPEPCYITFQWGYCAYRYGYDSAYRLGDRIYWRPSRDGSIRGWAGFGGNQFNVGDPNIRSVVVLDVGTDAAHFPLRCQACGELLGGAALHVKENRIVAAWAFRPGELWPGQPAVYYTMTPQGQQVPLPVSEAEPWQVVHWYVEQEDRSWLPMPEWEFRGCDYSEP